MNYSNTSKSVLDDFMRSIREFDSNTDLLNYLRSQRLISPDFEERYLLNNPDKEFSEARIVKKTNTHHIAFLESADHLPYRIEIIREWNTWKIASFTFQCMSCFGEYHTCGVCGGSGWGVL